MAITKQLVLYFPCIWNGQCGVWSGYVRERGHTHQRDVVLHCHIAFHRQAFQASVYNTAPRQSEDQCLVYTFFQTHLVLCGHQPLQTPFISKGFSLNTRLLPPGPRPSSQHYCLLSPLPYWFCCGALVLAPPLMLRRRGSWGQWPITVAIERAKLEVPPEPRGVEI